MHLCAGCIFTLLNIKRYKSVVISNAGQTVPDVKHYAELLSNLLHVQLQTSDIRTPHSVNTQLPCSLQPCGHCRGAFSFESHPFSSWIDSGTENRKICFLFCLFSCITHTSASSQTKQTWCLVL